MDNLKKLVSQNPRKPRGVGLKNATTQEIQDIKEFLDARRIPYKHKQATGTNGVLYVNPRD